MNAVKLVTRTNPEYQNSMVERGEIIYTELAPSMYVSLSYRVSDSYLFPSPPEQHGAWRFLQFETFRRLSKMYATIIRKATPKPPPKWKGLARYMTVAQRREAGELTHEAEYAKVTTLLETPLLEAVYHVDVPGKVPLDPRSLGGATREAVDIGNGDLAPEWGVELTLHGGVITYGPWADRQR